MSNIRLIYVTLNWCFVLAACKNSEEKQAVLKPTTAYDSSIAPNKAIDTLPVQTRNQLDSLGRKQGLWDHYIQGEVTGYETYRNNVLHGHYKYMTGYRDSVEGDYVNGKQEGIYCSWYNQDSISRLVAFYRNDTAVWIGFPMADYIVDRPQTIKGFNIETKDSILVKCPFGYGRHIFYEGAFKNKKPVGIHKIYYPNGQIKYISNWELRDFVKFDRKGKLIDRGRL